MVGHQATAHMNNCYRLMVVYCWFFVCACTFGLKPCKMTSCCFNTAFRLRVCVYVHVYAHHVIVPSPVGWSRSSSAISVASTLLCRDVIGARPEEVCRVRLVIPVPYINGQYIYHFAIYIPWAPTASVICIDDCVLPFSIFSQKQQSVSEIEIAVPDGNDISLYRPANVTIDYQKLCQQCNRNLIQDITCIIHMLCCGIQAIYDKFTLLICCYVYVCNISDTFWMVCVKSSR